MKAKRITSVLLCIVMICTMFCTSGVTAAEYFTVEGSFVTQNKGGEFTSKPVSVVLVSENGKEYKAEVTENGDIGVYSANIPAGIYDISISKPGYLTYTVRGVRVVNRDITISELAILPGDLNSDGIIDTKDLAVFIRGFNSDERYAELRELADFDEDGILNVTDMGYLKPNYDKSKENYEWTNIMRLRTDYRNDPMGIDIAEPEFNWAMESTKRGEKQIAYRIGVASSYGKAVSGDFDIWDSGTVESSDTRAYYGGVTASDGIAPAELLPATEYFWTVTSTNAEGKEIPSSQIAKFETGLFGDFGKDNKWIALGEKEETGMPYCEFSEGTIELNLTCTNKGVGFWFWTNEDDSQRHMWFFQLKGTLYNDGKPCLVQDYNFNTDSWKIGTPVDLTDFGLALNKSFDVRLEISSGAVKTYINDIYVADYTLMGENTCIGKVALRLSGDEAGVINSLTVKDASGNVFYTSDGEAESESSSVEEPTDLASVYFRKQFTLDQSAQNIAKARLYSTAAGNQFMYINGKRASDDYMAPGKSQYTSLLYYQTADVTDMFFDGDNTLAAEVGQGWYNAGSPHATYGTNMGLRAKLVITYNDGTVQIVDTDSSWLSTNEGPTYHNRFYDGQKVDARKTIDGWNENDNASDKWVPVTATDVFVTTEGHTITDNLVGESMEPVRNTHVFNPTSVTKYAEKDFIYQLDQNIAGTLRLTAKAPAGTKISIFYAEALKNGNCVDRNSTTYNNHNGVDEYIFRGDENGETIEFGLVYHGFRYIEIRGLSEALPLENIEALVLTSDIDRTGYFDSSNDTLDRYMENVMWSLRGNFVSTLTDCPTREKNTWTGDTHVFSHSGAYFADVLNHYRNFETMITSSQYGDGAVNEIVPIKEKPSAGSTSSAKAKTPAGWLSSVVLVPWEMYNQYGDVSFLENNYEPMRKWVQFLMEKKIYHTGDTSKTIPYYIDPEKADWLRLDGNYGEHLGYYSYNSDIGYRENEFGTTMYSYYETSFSEIETAYIAYTCKVMAEIANVLGETEDASYYMECFDNLAAAWRRNFLREDGYTAVSGGKTTKTTVDGVDVYTYDYNVKRVYGGKEYDNLGSQTSYCLGLYFDLYETPEKKAKAAENLVKLLEYENYRMTTGYMGVDFIFYVLADNGYFDVAVRVLENENSPSLLYMVKSGATTVWEGHSTERSQNHFMFGAASRWVYANLLGIGNNHNVENAGYDHFELNPTHPTYDGTKINWVKGSFDSVNGVIKSEWSFDKEANVFKYNCTVPANTSATLSLPVLGNHTSITEGGKDISLSEGVEFIEEKNGRRYYEITSGVYEFVVMDWADFHNADFVLDYEDISEDYYFQGRWIDMERDSVPVKVAINAGTEIHFKVSGTENVWLRLNTPTYREPYIAVSIDGGELVRMMTIKKGNFLIASGLSADEHTVRVIVDATPPYEQKKWQNGDGFSFECAVVDAGGTITGIKPKNKVIAYFGDSITEGNAVYKGGSPNPSDSSHINSYAFYTSTLLDCVSYTSGFSGTGVTKGGGGETPKCIDYIDNLMADTPFEMPTPDVIVFNHGANDPMVSATNISNFVNNYAACLDRLREKFPTTPIVCVQVFSSNNKGYNEIQQAIGDRENVYFIPTTDWCFTSLDNVHPDAVCAGAIGSNLANALTQVLGRNFFD